MKILKLLFLSFLMIIVIVPAITAEAYVSVKGYYRSDGTYVRPHVRSNPNGLKTDNYGYTPSQGIYNKTYGTRGSEWDTSTTITDPDYYEGKAIYESGGTGAGSSIKKDSVSKVVAPANAYVSGSYWFCKTGYREVGNKCVAK